MKAVHVAGFATLMALTSAFAQETAPAAEAEAAPEMKSESSLWAAGSIDISNGYIYDSGSVMSDQLSMQPWFGFGFDALGFLPLEFGAWGHYATSRLYEEQTQKHCFTEVDLSVGTSWTFDCGTAVSLSLITWQYPNMTGWNGEEVLATTISHSFGMLKVGSDFEFMLTGDCDNDLNVVPFAEVSFDITEDVSCSLYGQLQYRYAEGDGVDAWTAYNVKATISAFNFSVYAGYWGQISDKRYSDEEHDLLDTVYGISYAFEL